MYGRKEGPTGDKVLKLTDGRKDGGVDDYSGNGNSATPLPYARSLVRPLGVGRFGGVAVDGAAELPGCLLACFACIALGGISLNHIFMTYCMQQGLK